MEIQFLGGATTVTGSQYLLVTDRARVLINCGMFQGSPNESVRNRIPFAFDPAELDAVVLTHAHLDHCGLLPLLVKGGFRGPIYATRTTIELAGLVLLDSGSLHEEFARREARWERRHPDKAGADDRKEADDYRDALELAASGEQDTTGEHVETTIGGSRFIMLYALAGIAGGLLQVAVGPHSVAPVVGASGAIAGVFGAYAVLFARSRAEARRILGVQVSAGVVTALWYAATWIALQLLTAVAFNTGDGGIAIWTHIGGFIVGLAFAQPFVRRAA